MSEILAGLGVSERVAWSRELAAQGRPVALVARGAAISRQAIYRRPGRPPKGQRRAPDATDRIVLDVARANPTDGTRMVTAVSRDARGGTIDTAALRGRPYLVTLLYVNCPNVYPLISQDLKGALERLGSEARRVAVVAVSVDPSGDTRAAVRSVLRRQRLPSNFHYGIGAERPLRRIWRAYYAAPRIPGRPERAHSAAVWLVDAWRRWRAHLAAGC